MVYLDSSALVKVVVREPETVALQHYLKDRPQRITSALARVEVPRAVMQLGTAAIHRAREVLRLVDVVAVDNELLDSAADLEPWNVRSLDAIHLATARLFAAELEAVVTYDRRQAEAAQTLGLPVAAPRASPR